MAKKKAHVHKYQLIKWGKNQTLVFRCMLAGCPHYIHKEMALARVSLCHKCDRPFIMNKYSIERKYPKCESCVRTLKQQDPVFDDLDALLGGLT